MNDIKLLDLIKENKRLICSIINKYTNYYEFDDLYQVSVIGIIKAYQNFDNSYNVKFTTYAYKYILSEVINFINNSKLIKVSRDYQKIYKKILEARTLLTQKLMKEPTTKDLSLFLEIDEHIINDVLQSKDNIKSLDEILESDDKKITLLDTITSSNNNIDLNYLQLQESLNTLTKEELELINYRYFQDKTQSEIAHIFGTNQVKISRNEQKILKKLKNNLCKTL